MSIWNKKADLSQINQMSRQTLLEALNIQITELGSDFIKGTMPVNKTTHQPMGLLHGGASVALAESLGSIAGNMAASENHYCVGLEINANHLAKVTEGLVTGTAKPIHLGQQTQVWEIKIHREDNKLACISRLTLAVLPKQKNENRQDHSRS